MTLNCIQTEWCPGHDGRRVHVHWWLDGQAGRTCDSSWSSSTPRWHTTLICLMTSLLIRNINQCFWFSLSKWPYQTRSFRSSWGLAGDAPSVQTMNWFDSYLADRKQSFQQGVQRSGPHPVSRFVPQGSILGHQEFVAYTEDLECLIDRQHLGHHLYADDMQRSTKSELSRSAWRSVCTDGVPPAKHHEDWNDLVRYGHQLKDNQNIYLMLRISSDVIKPIGAVRDLGVLLDQELSIKQHICKVTSTCFYQLRRLKQVGSRRHHQPRHHLHFKSIGLL